MRNAVNFPETLLDPERVAAILGVSVKTLNVWRCTGRYALPFAKIGARVKYRASDVERFIARRTVTPNAPEAA